MKILHLTLHGEWYKMISQDIKKEEYRELKPFWKSRLQKKVLDVESKEYKEVYKSFDAILFKNGYRAEDEAMLVELKGIEIGPGNPDWGGRSWRKLLCSEVG